MRRSARAELCQRRPHRPVLCEPARLLVHGGGDIQSAHLVACTRWHQVPPHCVTTPCGSRPRKSSEVSQNIGLQAFKSQLGITFIPAVCASVLASPYLVCNVSADCRETSQARSSRSPQRKAKNAVDNAKQECDHQSRPPSDVAVRCRGRKALLRLLGPASWLAILQRGATTLAPPNEFPAAPLWHKMTIAIRTTASRRMLG
jgi:hypothetical protein